MVQLQSFEIMDIISELIMLSSIVLGVGFFWVKKAPLYFRILTLGLACRTAVAIFYTLYYLCYREEIYGLGIMFFGFFGCYLFFLSANFGQYDSFIDDGDRKNMKYRIIPLIAPLAILAIAIYYVFGNLEGTSFIVNALSFVGVLPLMAASYFNLKHAIFPDMGFKFVKYVRAANICMLLIEVLEIARVLVLINFGNIAEALVVFAMAVIFLIVILTANRGRELWLQ